MYRCEVCGKKVTEITGPAGRLLCNAHKHAVVPNTSGGTDELTQARGYVTGEQTVMLKCAVCEKELRPLASGEDASIEVYCAQHASGKAAKPKANKRRKAPANKAVD